MLSVRFSQSVSIVLLLVALLALSSQVLAGGQGKSHDPEILNRILDRVEEVADDGGEPAVVFDIDDTLLLTAPRTKVILLGYALKYPNRFPGLRDRVVRLDPKKTPHGLHEVLKILGITDRADVQEVRAYWLPRLLSNLFVHADWPIEGAVNYVRALQDRGATVVYCTARSDRLMSPGTAISMRDFGFPLDGAGSMLFMNTHEFDRSYKYKAATMQRLSKKYTLVAVFENEPGNLNAMWKAAPSAQPVFIDTVHSSHAPPLEKGIPRIWNYLIPPHSHSIRSR